MLDRVARVPPGRPDARSRIPELDAVAVPTLVVQGDRDPFGMPPEGPRRTVVVVPGEPWPAGCGACRRGCRTELAARRPRRVTAGVSRRPSTAPVEYHARTMAYDEILADRIRALLMGVPDVAEKRMFGGLAFMVQGNMACGPVNDVLIVRVGPDVYDDALAHGEASEMAFTGRPMRGMVQIGVESLDDDDLLAAWVERGVDFALSLPPK